VRYNNADLCLSLVEVNDTKKYCATIEENVEEFKRQGRR